MFERHDAAAPPLQPPYDGPYLVQKMSEKDFTVMIRNNEKNIFLDSQRTL